MKIAQVAPLIESVPPRLYGGTERIVSYLTEELVRHGHEVTLFASGDSITGAELSSCCTRAFRLDPTVHDILPHYMLMIDKVRERADEFDVLHFHIDLFHFPLFRSLAARTLTTLHGRLDLGDLKPFYYRFGEMPLVSVSTGLSEARAVAEAALDHARNGRHVGKFTLRWHRAIGNMLVDGCKKLSAKIHGQHWSGRPVLPGGHTQSESIKRAAEAWPSLGCVLSPSLAWSSRLHRLC
jgi:glycosyltransferase involved in cell wall biosynthesis